MEVKNYSYKKERKNHKPRKDPKNDSTNNTKHPSQKTKQNIRLQHPKRP